MSVRQAIANGLAASATVSAVRGALAVDGVWVVGGAVRDAALGVEVTDVDLAVAGDPRAAAVRLADALGGSPFRLSDERGAWRVVDAERNWIVDVSALRGAGIEEDLRGRDLTVNAIAVPLAGGEPVDPLGGIEDIAGRRLRAASDRAFSDDPLRLMRVPRLAAGLGFEVEPATARLARRDAAMAAEPAGERSFAELRGMVAGPDPLRAVSLLDELGLTAVVLPELEALRGVEQSANHHLDVHEHTIEVLRRWLGVEDDLAGYVGEVAAGPVAAALAEPLADGLTHRDGIRLAALLHDIGKPATRSEQDGFVGFRGHDRVGAEMVHSLCRRFRTSRRLADHQAALTRHHLALGFMVHEMPLPRRRVWDYLSLTGREAIDVTLLTVADRLSAQGSVVPSGAIEAHLALARQMIEATLELERAGPPVPLLRGDEIAALLGIEGSAVGEAVAELAAAQYAGEVGDRAEAERHLRAWRGDG